jgi:hypothetical protein
MTREEAIKVLELIQRKEALMQEYKIHYPATWDLPIDQCSDEQLQDIIAVHFGLPLGTVFNDEQIDLIQSLESPRANR